LPNFLHLTYEASNNSKNSEAPNNSKNAEAVKNRKTAKKSSKLPAFAGKIR
jgi:hypothetical protein